MTTVEAIDQTLHLHFGRSDFGLEKRPHYWAKMILNADLHEAGSFHASKDAVALEELHRSVREVLVRINGLTYHTKTFKPKAHGVWLIREFMEGRKRDIFEEALVALENLDAWIGGIREHQSFRRQAHAKRNWRAASVTKVCRIVWAAWDWEQKGRQLPKAVVIEPGWPLVREAEMREEQRALQAAYSDYLVNAGPKTEKHDAPGHFGQFLEDIFEVLGITGKNGKPFPAASALRSLRDALKQETGK